MAIDVAVERIVVWQNLACTGAPEVIGTPLPDSPPPPQDPPKKGTGPRIDHGKAARRAARLPNVELGWIGADGFPVVGPVEITGTRPGGMLLRGPTLPPGGRRAGLTAHAFSRGVIGQNQRKHTGWLDVEPDGGEAVYAPHTESSYRFPANRTLYQLVSGGGTRWHLRSAPEHLKSRAR
jgi:hypothetical protein